MAYEGEVRRVHQALRSTGAESRNKQNRLQSFVDQRTRYWKGPAADMFSKEYGGIAGDIGKLMRCIDRAGDALRQLPSLIARAEDERRRAAAKEAENAAAGKGTALR